MRRGLLLISTVLIAVAVVPVATASPPDRYPVLPPEDKTITDQCAFPVLAHIEGGEFDTTFFDKDGDVVKIHGVFPGQTSTWTNLETGKSITLTDAGAFHAQAERDGSARFSITGHGPIDNSLIDEPGIWYLDGGQVSGTADAHGNLTSVAVKGNLVNLCTLLAS